MMFWFSLIDRFACFLSLFTVHTLMTDDVKYYILHFVSLISCHSIYEHVCQTSAILIPMQLLPNNFEFENSTTSHFYAVLTCFVYISFELLVIINLSLLYNLEMCCL